ncbi:MAG: TonB-dependent receptor, partial [Bryobacteraceae bacterium]|nr:TonB-dependent receptor [Bryobacteraceae bacterium]
MNRIQFGMLMWALSAAELVWGQTSTASITGRLSDATEAIVPGAEVVARNSDTGVERRTVSNQEGAFALSLLPPGTYQVTIRAAGFRPASRTGIPLIVNQTVRVDFVLEVGTVSEAVEVSAATNQIQMESSKIVSAVTNKMVDELPLVVGGAMRSPFDLAVITPEANQPEGVGSADTSLNIGGGQASAYGATLDGVSVLSTASNRASWSAMNTPSVDAITEFAVESNGFKAEYGRGQGGMITFSSKSGTNELNGTAYEFLRNNALDSRRYFEDKRGVYKQHDFGWSLGGPVYIPKIYDGRSKTFFFSSMEWFRNRVGAASGRFTVPTPEMYGGDFTNWVDQQGRRLPVYDPATTRANPAGAGFVRTPFANNMIPASRFARFSTNVMKVVELKPNVNAAPGTGEYVRDNFINSTGTQRSPSGKFSVKADHNFSSNDRASLLYNFSRQEVLPGPDGFPGLPGVASAQRAVNRESPVYRASYTKVISPSVVNYAYGGTNGYHEGNRSPNHVGGWKAKGICLNNVEDCDATFPQISFSDYAVWGASGITGSRNFVYSFGDDLTVTRGRHTFKMGYLYERLHYYGGPMGNPANRAIAGWVTFDRRSTSVPNNNTLATGGGNSFASFLLGDVYSGLIETAQNNALQWKSHSVYLQDDWRVTSKLTLNIGLRYEFTQPTVDRLDQISDFTPNLPNPRAGGLPGALRFAGFGEGRQNSRTLVPGWYGGFGPRFGLAYSLDSKTVLRAGIGRSFGVAKTNTGTSHFDGFRLVASPASTDNGITPVFHADTGFPAYPRPPVIDPSFANGLSVPFWDDTPVRLPENYQWTFGLQRQLSNSMVLEATYNATIGAHLLAYLKNANQVPFSRYEQLGPALLASPVSSPAAIAAGIRRPYDSIDADFGGRPVSVAQALRPYPQYQSIDTGGGQGDKSGHSSYHAMALKLDRRFGSGVTFQGSYVLSKILTDADRFDAGTAAMDHYNRRLEKSIGMFDQTHNLKMSYVWELPVGKGKKLLSGGGPLAAILGDWRLAGIQLYSSGFPIGLVNSINYLVFNGRSAAQVPGYDGWIVNHENPNWKGSDRFFQPNTFFGPQLNTRLGNSTRFNPKARTPWGLQENFSLAKSFRFTEDIRLDFRVEVFNAFNRSRFDTGPRNLDSLTFG